MFQKIIHFIKYHNAFTIGLMAVSIGFSASLAASPEVREVFVSSLETVRSIDNSAILAADFNNFNFNLQIKAVIEDERAYLVSYSYKTMAINDYVWQEVFKEGSLNVSKLALAGNDLGLYVAEELGELIDYQLAYLKEVQQIEKDKGLSQKVATVEYAGLIGRFLSPEEKVFEGYQPVVSPPEPAETAEETPSVENPETLGVESEPTPSQVVQQVVIQQTIDTEAIRQIVREMLAQQPASAPDGASAGEQAPAPVEPEPATPGGAEPTPGVGAEEQPPAEEPPAVVPGETASDAVEEGGAAQPEPVPEEPQPEPPVEIPPSVEQTP